MSIPHHTGFSVSMKTYSPMQFNVTVPVKPYVKRFLENNYGDPVDFRNHPRENELFKRMLKKPCHDNEHKYTNELCKQTHSVEILISERDFYRNGWELTKTDIVNFGKYFEKHAKWLMRTVVSTYVQHGTPVHRSIMNFQTRFMMEEEYWSFDSIKKDFYRLRESEGINLNEYAYQHMERLIRINMCKVGVITDKGVKIYEKNSVTSE